MNIVGTPDTQVWGGWHAGLGVPVWEASDGAILQGAAYSCLSTAPRAGEALVAAASKQKEAMLVKRIQCGHVPHWQGLTSLALIVGRACLGLQLSPSHPTPCTHAVKHRLTILWSLHLEQVLLSKKQYLLRYPLGAI